MSSQGPNKPLQKDPGLSLESHPQHTTEPISKPYVGDEPIHANASSSSPLNDMQRFKLDIATILAESHKTHEKSDEKPAKPRSSLGEDWPKSRIESTDKPNVKPTQSLFPFRPWEPSAHFKRKMSALGFNIDVPRTEESWTKLRQKVQREQDDSWAALRPKCLILSDERWAEIRRRDQAQQDETWERIRPKATTEVDDVRGLDKAWEKRAAHTAEQQSQLNDITSPQREIRRLKMSSPGYMNQRRGFSNGSKISVRSKTANGSEGTNADGKGEDTARTGERES